MEPNDFAWCHDGHLPPSPGEDEVDVKLLSASAACITLLTTGLCAGQTQALAPLPLTRLRLYETGVGYFERTGKLPARGNIGLPVPTGHLDDALKTLVVLSTDTSTEVSGIEFGSSLSRNMGRALAGLSPDADAPLGFKELLTSLKARSVEIASRQGNFKGRIIDVIEAQASEIEECVAVRTVQVHEPKGRRCGVRRIGSCWMPRSRKARCRVGRSCITTVTRTGNACKSSS